MSARTRYDNTPDAAESIGWPRVPEHCRGLTTARYVTHDHEEGTFTFHDSELVPDSKPLSGDIFLLGHRFSRASAHEMQGFAGCGPNTYIWSDDGVTLLYDRDEGTVCELPCDPPEGGDFKRHWDVTLGDRP